ncbi:MAG: glycosyltransferase family 4 protein [Bacteroidaceae bacterium]|nr:glycosyltransferase family 4 protein [Bacteroidaceae bacterium]
MRVLIINTSERTGGAAIAANRLMDALQKNGIKAKMLVRDKETDKLTVASIPSSWTLTVKFLWERFIIWINNRLSKRNLFMVDIANTGTDITQMFEFKQADVIHLHWINQGFLSLKDIDLILKSGKPVVITMHDMWYFTGICHHAGKCNRYKFKCESCPLIYGGIGMDLAKKVFRQKRHIYRRRKIVFVGCSQWMTSLCLQSRLTRGQTILNIPNPIDVKLFTPMDVKASRELCKLPTDKYLILFCSRRITDYYKGFQYLADACKVIKEKYPDIADRLGVVVLGEDSDKIKTLIPLDVYPVDYMSNQQAVISLYNAVDLFVTPSLQENLPNTIMESMACGTPCVGFNIGGIPEMIDHMQNGYVAQYRDAEDFAKGIQWCLAPENYSMLCANARQKVLDSYSEEHIAHRYTEVYEMARQLQ